MIDNEAILITKEKKDALEEELRHLKVDIRPGILDRLQFAKSLGDLSENAEYHSAREEQGKNEDRIKEIEYTLKYAEVIEKNNSGVAGLASVVIVQKEGDKEKREFTLVSAAEADMTAGKISIESPIGAALVDKSKGDKAEIVTPGGKTTYKIIEVK